MFQRLRDAIDRTVAEEQARQKEQQPTPSRSGSTTKRTQGKTANSDVKATDTAPNPDPAVFEAAFVIDDEDDPSRAGTPKPAPPEKDDSTAGDSKEEGAKNEKMSEGAEAKAGSDEKKHDGPAKETGSTDSASQGPGPLSPDVKKRLQKLDKMEKAYPELLRSYRLAHRRVTAIDTFEKALRENTPFTSISDPTALTEYIDNLNRKSDMAMEELRRVSGENDELKKQRDQDTEKVKKLEEELKAAKSGNPTEAVATDKTETPRQSTDDKEDAAPEKVKSPVASVMGMFSPKQKAVEKTEAKEDGDFFSYDEEIPQLQSDLASKSEEIEQLRAKIVDLETKLSAAQDSSASMVEDLEKAKRELSDAREANTTQESFKSQLEARAKEIETSKERLAKAETARSELQAKFDAENKSHAVKVKELEASKATSDKRASELDAELTKASNAKNVTVKLIDDLNTQIATLKKEKTDCEAKIDALTKKLESSQAQKTEPTASTAQPAPAATPATATGGSKKKNNKKKKGKGGAAATPAAAAEEATPEGAETEATHPQGSSNAETESEIKKLKEELVDKDARIENLAKQVKVEEDLREEIESLREDLMTIGNDHVEAKDKIKTLEAEKAELKVEIADLEKKIAASANIGAEASGKHQAEKDKLQKEFDDLKEKSATLKSDLGASEQLAQQRFKEITDLKDILQKAQPELKSLRQESSELKTAKQELATKKKELQEAEKKEKELKRDLDRVQKQSADREAEVKSVQEKLASESAAKARLEDEKRVAGRDLRRAESEKKELSTKAENAEKELAKIQEEVSKLRPRVKELEEQMHKLRRDNSAAQEEVDFKNKQYANAQELLTSMRDQVAESSTQLKESKSQSEALEEELAEVQRLLQERTRDTETMRRLLAEQDERTDSKVREMRNRMESAIEERDRIEDESSTLARRKARELEEYKGKIRELERDVKTLGRERDELEEREKEWRRRKEELESVEEKADAEASELRSTNAQLRSALDASEGQVRDAEKQRAELRKLLDEAKQRYERAQRELKTTQSKLVAGSSRSSMDSSRSGTPANGQAPGGGDLMYLKTILLQFLEQKDGKLRAQLVPVLGKLLQFNQTEEQKWKSAVQHIEVR